ncbi:hypothetical protein ABT369_03405 [Dactylosporangium sp. NPDC000244]|uniref:hypothetical protein n=1 Tax=Dactylosporangium sp. NPDC000244 TaxID=3154365 RepID=UPI00331C4D71
MITTADAAASTSTTIRNIVARFRDHATSQPHRIAVIDAVGATTYGELWQQAYEYFAYHQPAAGAIVPIAVRPASATLAATLGVWLGGGIPLPIPNTTRPKLVATAVQRATRHTHHCRPWRAHLHAEQGSRYVYLAGGEPPTVPRIADAIGLTPGGIALIAAPLHRAAIFDIAIRQLCTGGTIVLRPDFTTDDWLATAVETGADWAILAPGMVLALLQHQDTMAGWLTVATRTLRRVVVPATVPAINVDHLAALTTGTDTTVTVWYHAPTYDGAHTTSQPFTVLAPLPGTRLRVVDPTGRPTPPGMPGLIEGASSSDATAHRADQPCPPPTAWRTIGDIGTLTPAGNLTLTRLEPANHYLDPYGVRTRVTALRQALTDHPDLTSTAVYIVPDQQGLRRAHVQAWTTTALTATALAHHCAAHGAAITAEQITITTDQAAPTAAGAR